MASRLLEYLMENAGHNNWQVFKNNLEVIRTLVECWRNKLDIPTKYDYSIIRVGSNCMYVCMISYFGN